MVTPPVWKATLKEALGDVFSFRGKNAPQTVPTGILEIDSAGDLLRRGAITEIVGPRCSGRTTLLHSILSGATGRGEVCALVDVSDAFDPASASAAGVDLRQLLWVRCATRPISVLPVTDLLLQNGGWGIIALDLADIHPQDARRIPLHAWFRFRRAIENQSTVFIVVGSEPYAGSCSSLVIETEKTKTCWTDSLLRGAAFTADFRKPQGRPTVRFEAIALR